MPTLHNILALFPPSLQITSLDLGWFVLSKENNKIKLPFAVLKTKKLLTFLSILLSFGNVHLVSSVTTRHSGFL